MTSRVDPDGPMVARDAELGVLRGVFDRAVGVRTAQLLTIFGTAGVGKSRLVREFVAALPDGVTVLRGRCLPYGEGITYWPVIEIVRAVAGIKETDDAAAARGRLDALLPEAPEDRLIAGRLAEVLGLEPGRARQEELFWALRRLVEWVAIDRPVVLIVDDIHWAEPTLLDLIEHLADLIRGSAVLIIASARPELLEDRPTWGGGRLNATAILLEPLGESAATVLIDQLVPGSRAACLLARPDRAARPKGTRCTSRSSSRCSSTAASSSRRTGSAGGSPTDSTASRPAEHPGASGRTPRPARSGGTRGRRTGLDRRPGIRGPSGEPPLARARASPGGRLPDIAGAQGSHPAGVAAPRR